MEREKISKNTEFTVKYDDGTTKEVKEGLLFEFDGNEIHTHLGTSRATAFFAVAEAYEEMVDRMGLRDELLCYLQNKEDDRKIELECGTCSYFTPKNKEEPWGCSFVPTDELEEIPCCKKEEEK